MEKAERQKLHAQLMTFQEIAAPVLAAITETGPNAGGGVPRKRTPENDAKLFSELIEHTTQTAKFISEQIGAAPDAEDDWVRWGVARTASLIVASYYRATAGPPPDGTKNMLLNAIKIAIGVTENIAPSKTSTKIRSIEAMTHLVAAVARFAFGRTENDFLTQIAQRVEQETVRLTKQFLPPDANADEKQKLYESMMEGVAKLYAESHYAEMDRLLDMPPDERASYVKEHNNQPPIDPIWQGFDLRIQMLETVAKNLKLKADSVIQPLEA